MTTSREALQVVEICAGAGGQALGLEKAGFEHALAVEIDDHACATLQLNRPSWMIAKGDVADPEVWDPAAYRDRIDLFAGGVPCPPFSIAGKQLGASDERDLFAWAVSTAVAIKPRALLLENVRGLSMPRFAAYRQHVLDTLSDAGYVGQWRLLQASDFGVPQLRPRFVLVALRESDAPFFAWPEPTGNAATVGDALEGMMAANGWPHAAQWAQLAHSIAPTIVGGSKKHGGADLGPTRAKRAWAALGVNGLGVADEAPGPDWPEPTLRPPKLTVEMVALLQGWAVADNWKFAGRKTAMYRQIGNAFPPPLAQAVGQSIADALRHKVKFDPVPVQAEHDGVYRVLRESNSYLSQAQIMARAGGLVDVARLEQHISNLSKDFEIDVRDTSAGPVYRLGDFRAFVGQDDHNRHAAFADRVSRSKIS